MELGTLSVKVKTELRELETGLRRGGQMVQGYSAKVEGYLRTHAASFRRMAQIAVVAVAAAGAAIMKLVKDAVIYGEQMDKMAKVTGIGAEAMGKLAYIAEQEHGSLESLTKSFPILAKYMAYAAQGMETYKREFDKMGFSVTDATGKLRKVEDVFYDMADYFATNPDSETEKLAVAMALLGRRGAELIPMLKLGKDAFKTIGDEAVRLGIVLSTEDAAAMKKFGDSITTVKGGIRGIGIGIAKELLPQLNEFAGWINQNMPLIKEQVVGLAESFTGVGQALTKFLGIPATKTWSDWRNIQRLLVQAQKEVDKQNYISSDTLKELKTQYTELGYTVDWLPKYYERLSNKQKEALMSQRALAQDEIRTFEMRFKEIKKVEKAKEELAAASAAAAKAAILLEEDDAAKALLEEKEKLMQDWNLEVIRLTDGETAYKLAALEIERKAIEEKFAKDKDALAAYTIYYKAQLGAIKDVKSDMVSEFIGAFEWKPSAMLAGGGREFGSRAPVVSQQGGNTVLQLTVNVDSRAGLHQALDRQLDRLQVVN